VNEPRLPVLRALPSEIAARALVVGEPERAEWCARLLDNAVEVGRYREYRTFTGRYEGVPITICSHGVGSGGAAVAFHELFLGGVTTIIRAGTCGAMQPGIADGQLIVGTGAVRNEGTSNQLVPIEYPAVAHHQVVAALLKSCGQHEVEKPPTGIVLTNATLYPGLLDKPIDIWVRSGVVAIEMEFATLLVMAGIRNVRAGGLFVSDGNAVTKRDRGEARDFTYNPHREVVKANTQEMLKIAVAALAGIE
jgi:uridine phosphorylase